jgi:hypothetical protein
VASEPTEAGLPRGGRYPHWRPTTAPPFQRDTKDFIVTIDKRTQRKIDRQLQSESRWLQKVLFNLGKAREARAKLSDVTGSEPDPVVVVKNSKIALDDLEEAIQARVKDVMEQLGQGIHRLPS